MVNTIGAVPVNTGVALGVVPAGSGNGFARHFGIPLTAERAVESLLQAERVAIDVGTANGRPFFVTCGMAWDAAIVRTFEKSPVRGVLPYVFAGAYEFFEYQARPFEVQMDEGPFLSFSNPLLFTVANLTQYRGGAKVAPTARPDDGYLELVHLARSDATAVLTQLPRLFDGNLDRVPQVKTHRVRSLLVRSSEPGPVQLDGELLEEPAEASVGVLDQALTVLVPGGGEGNGEEGPPGP